MEERGEFEERMEENEVIEGIKSSKKCVQQTKTAWVLRHPINDVIESKLRFGDHS